MIPLFGDPLFHRKLALMKQFVKAQNKEGSVLSKFEKAPLFE